MCALKSPLLCLFDTFAADFGLLANTLGAASVASIYFVMSSSVLPSIV